MGLPGRGATPNVLVLQPVSIYRAGRTEADWETGCGPGHPQQVINPSGWGVVLQVCALLTV